jgi:hypothetical protein
MVGINPPVFFEVIVNQFDSTQEHDDYPQAGKLYRIFDDAHRDRLARRIAGLLGQGRPEVQLRQICRFFRADEDLPRCGESWHRRQRVQAEGWLSRREFNVRRVSMKLSVASLLAEADIPAEAGRALVDNRLEDAAELLMQEYGLSCVEAGYFLNIFAC